MEMYDTVTDLAVQERCGHGKRVYVSVTGVRHFAADGGGLCMKYDAAKKVGPQLVTRKEGDIWRLPKSTSPMWTEQWGYQGSSKVPYIISHNSEKIDGSTTGDGWACSCPNFTRNTPRTPCKHILNIMLTFGYGNGQTKGSAKLANVDEEKLKAFEAWEREQAAAKKQKPTAGDAKLNLFGATGRKFR